jgi:hypothetical protein
MTASTAALQKGLDSARSSLAGFGKSLLSMKSLIAGSFAGAGAASLMHFASLADDLADNAEKLETMFGSASAAVIKQSEAMSAAFGTSQIEFTAMGAKMGGIFKSLGVAEEPAAAMTAQLGVLAQAIANFKGIGFEQGMAMVAAGMAGKGKALKEFGISVKASMSAQERFNALMSGGADVIGAMSQRAMDAGAAWAEFRGRIEQIEIELGKNLPELVEPFFKELNTAVVAAMEYFKSLKSTTLDWGEGTLAATKSAADGMGFLQTAIGGIADAFQFVAGVFHTWQANFTGSLAVIVDALVALDKWLEKNLPEFLGGGKPGANREFLEAFSDNLHITADKEFEDLKKEWAKPRSSEGFNASFDAARKKIDEARKDVMGSALKVAAQAGAKPAVKSTAKTAGEAFALGSKEQAAVFVRSRYQTRDDKDMKKLSKNSDKQVELLGRIADGIEAGDGAEVLDDF